MEQIDVGLENWAANLAARLQLDSPAPSRPPLVSSGASSSSADAALGQAPIQSAASLELLQELQRGLHHAPGAAGPSSLAPAAAETAAAAAAEAKAANQGRARVLAAAAERGGRSDVPRDDWMAAFQGDQGRDLKQAQLQTELQEATDAVNASAWQQMR